MRPLRLIVVAVVTLWAAAPAAAQPVKNRIAVLVDSSGSMLLTPEIVTYTETCAGWNPCTFLGAPSAAQRTCNACVRDTINFRASCATNWTATCQSDYAGCITATVGGACSPTLTTSNGVATRGDGSADLTGCDVNGDGLANDSRMYQAKEALNNVVATFGEVEFSLWRYAQVTGGQTCTTDASCPDTPGGLSVLTCEDQDNNAATPSVCAFDADLMDNVTTAGFEGQCALYTHTGAPAGFNCSACNYTNSYDRALCEIYKLDGVRTGGVSPLNGTSAVTCFPTANPQHRFMKYHGAFINAGACDPLGGQRLVDFPANGYADNYPQIAAWIDHNQNPFASTDELRPQGGTPIAASLRDMRASLLAAATADPKTPCRKYQAIVLTDGGESCESVAAAVTAARSFQNLAFTNAAGTVVPDFDIPVYVIGFAICPPGQPNCQTRQDLNAIAAAGGTSQAILVNNQLELQLALAQIVASSVVAERCNSLDDDCDGRIDEDFPGLGSGCSAGVGTCYDAGTVVCTPDQLGLVCDATPGAPSPEVCNNLDDNCDGLVDNGVACTSCVPVCTDAAGCDVCNNLDEDCDGIFDEDFTPTSCGVDTGACAPGTTACVGGVLACSGGVGPVAETCNNVDDDCDAIVDGMAQPCYPAGAGCNLATGVCQGVCRLGTQTCTAGSYGACAGAVTPGVEVACNLQDDDCDGRVDEGAGTEQCNGVDDDCDGRVDEGVASTDPDIGTACGTPPFVGVCHPGAVACVAGAQVCVGEVDPGIETCNNRDDDCDGVVDDDVPGFGGPCGSDVGRCDPGTLQCVGGAPQCVGAVGPFPEVCNGLDDNCNSAIDETDPSLGTTCATLPGGGSVTTDAGECRFGVLVCTAGGLECVGAVGPAAELCNALDDDCDGQSDEAFPTLGQACDNGQLGVCRQTGVVVCAPGGAGVACTAGAGLPGVETCNGLDDDCDGTVDEGPLPLVGTECAPAAGVCVPGLWACTAGQLVCGAPSSGQPEVCNGVDDDCDAQVDEHPPGAPLPGEGEACVEPGFEPYMDIGECAFGTTTCVAGGLDCIGYQGPSPEICDGLDNDCDGVADDSATCPAATDACHAGTCVVPCASGEFPCPGATCAAPRRRPVTGDYHPGSVRGGVVCRADEVCDPATRTCHGLCDGISCPTGTTCRAGTCLDCFALPSVCMPGQRCVADDQGVGQCQDNPCDPNPCGPNEVCTDGTCSGGCGAGCPSGQACVGGACVADACDGVTCPGTRVCDPSTGACVNDLCSGVQCRPGEVCVPVSGACIPDPCDSTTCPLGQVCAVDPGGRPVCGDPDAPTVDRVTAAGGGCAAGGAGGGGLGSALGLGLALAAVTRRRRGGAGGAA
ncbi:MAG: MopE-related protein [Kofleriaceae bacterium]